MTAILAGWSDAGPVSGSRATSEGGPVEGATILASTLESGALVEPLGWQPVDPSSLAPGAQQAFPRTGEAHGDWRRPQSVLGPVLGAWAAAAPDSRLYDRTIARALQLLTRQPHKVVVADTYPHPSQAPSFEISRLSSPAESASCI